MTLFRLLMIAVITLLLPLQADAHGYAHDGNAPSHHGMDSHFHGDAGSGHGDSPHSGCGPCGNCCGPCACIAPRVRHTEISVTASDTGAPITSPSLSSLPREVFR